MPQAARDHPDCAFYGTATMGPMKLHPRLNALLPIVAELKALRAYLEEADKRRTIGRSLLRKSKEFTMPWCALNLSSTHASCHQCSGG